MENRCYIILTFLLKIRYPYLKEVWTMYDEFESPVERDPKINNYISLCHGFITVLKESKEQYNDFCMKLARNLGLYSEDRKITNPSHDRCNILYNWIYNSIKKYHIPDNIIKECFDEYDRIKKATGNIKCYYYTYNNTYEEPENILLLNIFKSYFETITDIMNGDLDNYISSGHKYICEFVNIYNKMNSNYCLGKGPNGQKQQNTCGYLSTFKNNYNIFLYSQLKKKDNIPSLDDDYSVYMNKCKSDKQKTVLQARVHNEHPQFPHSSGGTRENLDTFSYQPTVGNYDTNTSISSTVSTAVGTVAGASSILALLYKFTPGRKWIHSGFGGRRERINSNLYDAENSELLFDGQVHGDYGPYNQRYDIGYSPI